MNQAWMRDILLSVLSAVFLFLGFNANTSAGPVNNQSEQQLAKSLADQGARVSRNPRGGRVVFIGTDHGKVLSLPGMGPGFLPEDSARAALNMYAPLFGIKDPGTELKTMKQLDTSDGRFMTRYQQVYQGLPVIGGEMIVNLDSLGRMSSMNGEVKSGLNLEPTPVLTSLQAQEKAISVVATIYNVDANKLSISSPVLSVYAPELIGPPGPGPVLVWRMGVVSSTNNMIDEFVLVDARRGAIALHFSNVKHAKDRKTYDVSGVTSPSQLPGVLLCSEATADNCTGGVDADADTASLYAGDTYDFYYDNFGRDSIDGKGMTISSGVHFDFSVAGGSCPNAGWSDTYNQMFYCDGMPEGDDVDAHELTHGITSRTSDLFYWYQSGAINESMSDVFGEFIDLTNGHGTSDVPDSVYPAGTRWEIGEDSAVGVIRDMWDPTRFGDPDKMTSANYYTGTSDNGGVHTNSGVNNHAAALMVDGGTFNSITITGIGITKAAQIYYEAQNHLLTSGSDYFDLYNALYQGCTNLVGTHGITNSDCTEVRNATLAVEMNKEPVTGFNPDAGFCPTAGDVPNNLFFDGFEGDLKNWTKGGITADSVWGIDALKWFPGPYAASGDHSLYGDDYVELLGIPIPSDSNIAMANGVSIPSGGLYLRFDHAWGLYLGDGTLLEYSIDNSSYNDASSLFDAGQDYNGISSTLGGQSAWINSSHGYVSSRYHITTNVGSKIKFRYRLGTGILANYGWWIDNVRLYTCVANTPPTAPKLVSPGDGSKNVDSTVDTTFKWNPSTDIDGDTINYNLKVCTDPGFTSCVTDITKSAVTVSFAAATLGNGFGLMLAGMLVAGRRRKLGGFVVILAIIGTLAGCGGGSSSGPSSLSYVVPASTFSPGTTYYWHVTATDSNLASTMSVDWSFTTAP